MPAEDVNEMVMLSSTSEERHLELKMLAAYSAAGMLNNVKAADVLDDVEKASKALCDLGYEHAAMMG